MTNSLFSGGNFLLIRDHIFNKATSNISVETKDGEIQLKKGREAENEKKILYGGFVKSGGAIVEKKDFSLKITDEELLEACEGRTASKGARASQEGKLERMKKFDAGMHDKYNLLDQQVSGVDSIVSENSKKTKGKVSDLKERKDKASKKSKVSKDKVSKKSKDKVSKKHKKTKKEKK